MHFNLDNDYRLSPSLDHGGEFMYTDVSDCSTYEHPPIHYKLMDNPDSVRVINHIPAGNVQNRYEDIEFMMKSFKTYGEMHPEILTEDADLIELGPEALFPKWMNMSKMDFVNIKTGIEDRSEIGLEFDQKYMSIYQHESSYHSLSSTEEFNNYQEEMKEVMDAIDKKDWNTVQAFQHLDSHRYEMVAQKDSPIMDLERPMQGDY